ncbi:conjugal transfer protein TraC [Candidatus Wirthbacteria bacterium CG2_30_54_11]|uniref:Conjugal transfer protein TraC n=1 Tax=Candidatus Wirthbacteria bacterium CG2_30_54_11 TaxID=1817892 RepID=A0A1J5IK99_9BACT|nr:MAG: conjugal transfer protein TraC [Candidatus Wirthbacteria bacterium CG2_30_54_11]
MGLLPGKKGNKKDQQAVLEQERLARETQRVLQEGMSTIKDIIAPPSIELDPSYLKIGNKYHRTLFVSGYPRYVSTNWLSPLINFNADIAISLYQYPIDSKSVMEDLKRRIGQMEATWQINQEKGLVKDPELETQLQDAHNLRDAIQRGEEKFFQFGLYMTVSANGKEELSQLCQKVESMLGGMLIYTKETAMQMEQGFKTTLPLCNDHIQVLRNMDTSALSSTFPFTSSDLTTNEGILYGLNRHNNSLVIFDRFKLENANSVIFAKSGAGKSYTVKLEALRYLMIGTEVLIIDPEREYKALCESVGGTYINISLNSKTHINPFDMADIKKGQDLEGDELRSQIIYLLGLFAILLGELTNKEESLLDRALLEAYRQKGIISDPSTYGNTPPIMGDLYELLKTMPGAESVVEKMEKFVHGTLAGIFNMATNVELNNNFIVFDIRDLEDILRPMAMFSILQFIWNKVRTSHKRRLLLVDEAWIMMQHEDSARFLFGLAKRARKYWLGLTTITQDVDDFLSSSYGKAIVTNSSMQVLLKQSTAAIDKIATVFNLTEGEKYLLLECDVGEGLFFAGQNHVAIKIIASYIEDQIITTNPEKLAALEQEKTEAAATP